MQGICCWLSSGQVVNPNYDAKNKQNFKNVTLPRVPAPATAVNILLQSLSSQTSFIKPLSISTSQCHRNSHDARRASKHKNVISGSGHDSRLAVESGGA